MSRVYIAGPMTGIPHYNAPEFVKAAARFEEQGWEVWTPFMTNNVVWIREHGRLFDVETDRCEYGDPMLPKLIAENLREVCQCNAIALLPNWENSRGTKLEIHLAKLLGLPIYDATTMQPMEVTLTIHAFRQ